jgi:hypothetical protein
MEAGTILFARPLRMDGHYQEKDDIVEAWCLNACVHSHSIFISVLSDLILDATFSRMMTSNF